MKEVAGFLPWIGLAVALFALFVRGGERKKLALVSVVALPVGLALVAFIGTLMTTGDVRTALVFLAVSAVIGCVFNVGSTLLGTSEQGSLLSALGLTAFLVGTPLEGVAIHSISQFGGLVCGLAVCALPTMTAKDGRVSASLLYPVFASGVVLLLSRIGYRGEVGQIAPLLVWSALLSYGLLMAVSRAFADKPKSLAHGAAVAVFAGLAWLVLSRYLGEGDLALVCIVAIVATLITAWAVPQGKESVATWGMAAVIWLGLATFAFSTAFGLGMAVAGFAGLASLLLLGRRDLRPVVGLVVGLAVYRLFRENNAELVQAFDIGQHYAMIGFVLGIVVVVGVTDAVVRRRGSRLFAFESAIVGLLAAAIVVGASAFFGTKGAIGLVVGLAVGPLISTLTVSRTAWASVAAAALQGAALVAYKPFADDVSFDRGAKLTLLVWMAAGAVVLYGVLLYIGKTNKEVTHEA